jgi:transcriptional regulator with XRE-family HTH domain
MAVQKSNHQNVVGAQVRRLRLESKLTQDLLSARCGALGWDISRGTLSKVEAHIRCVTDRELWYLATALRVSLETLYPAKMRPPPKPKRGL